MKKKNNKKFTASKKGLVLSLACVSVLATAANATIEGLDQSSADKSVVKGDKDVVITSQISGGTLNLNGFSGSNIVGVTINSDIANGITNNGGSVNFKGKITNNAIVSKGANFGDITFSGGSIVNSGTINGGMTFGKLTIDGIANKDNAGSIINGGIINGNLSVKEVSISNGQKNSGSGISITNGGNITGSANLGDITIAVSGASAGADFVFENTAEGKITKDVNVGKISIESKQTGANGGFADVDIKNSGIINGSLNLNGAISISGPMNNDSTAAAVASVINAGTLGGIKINNDIIATKGGAFEVSNDATGSIKNFVIGKISVNVSDSGSVNIINSGSISSFINDGSFSETSLPANNSGGITILNKGNIDEFINNGKIDTKTGVQNIGTIGKLENSKNGYISIINNADASANANIDTLNNAGKITAIVNGGTDVYGTIGNIINTGSIGSGANTAAGIANNVGSVINTITNYGNIINGVFAGDSAAIYNVGSIGQIINSNKFVTSDPNGSGATSVATNAKIGNIVSSGGSASIGLIDNQNGTIDGIINRESSISTVQNTGTIKSIIATGSTTSDATFGTISNLKTGVINSIALSGAATINSIVNEGVIGNKNSANYNADAISMKSGGNSIASLVNTGSINGNITLVDAKVGNNSITTLTNAGTITGTITLDGGLLGSDAITNIGTLDNLENAKIGAIKVGGTSGGLISTLNNYGEITNGITITKGSGSIINLNNYSALGNIDTGKVGLTNNNTIDNLRNYETGSIVYAGTGTINKTLENLGTIALAKASNSINLVDGARVNNSGTISGSQDGSSAILLASGGAAISINNSGFIDVKNYKQSQIGVDGENASVNVESWRLRLNESANEFNNTPGYTYNVSKEGYVSGTFIPAEQTTPPADTETEEEAVQAPKGSWIFTNIVSGANTDTNRMNSNSHIYVSTSDSGKVNNINFLDKSIVLDLSNQGFELGQVYNMDNLVYSVNSTTGQLEGIGSAEWTIKDNGSGNGTLVYELSKAEAVNAGKGLTVDNLTTLDDIFTINETFIDTITKEDGTGTRVRGFSVGVDATNGAGAILAQGLTNVNARRSLFIDSITSTAIQATIDQTNRTQQVSYNDSEINFENLAKYAQISTDAYSATTNRDTYFYAMPYYTSDSMDLQGGFENLKGNTYGLVAGAQKNLYDAGIVGLFFGFESGSYDTSSAQTTYNQDDLTFYGGLNYYKVLGGTESREYYVKAMAKAALISSDISRTAGANGGSGDATAKSANFGVGADVGINFYLTDAHVISPEIGISYDRLNTESFTIGNQYYDESDVNLFQGKVGVNWLAQWSPVFSTNFGLGIKNNFTGDIDTAVVVANNRINQNVDLPNTYQYVQGGLSYMITNNIEVSLNYNGNYSSDTSSHSGLLRLGMWW